MKRTLACLLTLLALLLALLSPALAEENKFYFDKSVTVVREGDTLALYLYRTGDCRPEGELTFTSSQPRIATVDETGLVTGVSKGTVTITAVLKNGHTWKATIQLTIARRATSITVDESKLNVVSEEDPLVATALGDSVMGLPVLVLRAGINTNISATVYPTDATNRKYELLSSDGAIVRVNGVRLDAKKPGVCTVTIRSVQDPEVCRVYRVLVVKQVTKVTLVMAPGSYPSVGEQVLMSAAITPSDATIQAVSWSSSNTKVATVDENGWITCLAKGSTTIKATALDGSGRYATFKVTVKQLPESISLSETAFTLKTGNYKTLKATVLPASTSDKSVVWSSSNTAVAKVSGGKVTAVAPGTAVITCASRDFPPVYAQATVTVIRMVTKVDFVQHDVSVDVGGTLALSWEIQPEDATIRDVLISTNKPDVVSVTQDGRVTGLKRGECYVYVTAQDGSNKKGSVKVTVTQPVEGVTMAEKSLTLRVGDTESITALLSPADASNTAMTWYSEDARVATISGKRNKPEVTGRGWGTTTMIGVTADGGYVTTFQVTVADYDRALRITDLYAENDAVRIVVQNQSPLTITRFTYEIELYDAWGNALWCNTRNGSNKFSGTYNYALNPSASTRHGQFSFGREFSRPAGIGWVVMRLTSFTTSTGETYAIPSYEQEPVSWRATVVNW